MLTALKLGQHSPQLRIVRECNCWSNWGFSKLKSIYPEAYLTDLSTTKGDLSKLGTIQSITIERNGKIIEVILAYTKTSLGSPTNEEAKSRCVSQIKGKFTWVED